MEDIVVLTVRSWDGSRLLGAYSSMEKAIECQKTFTNNNKSDSRHKEEFEFDVMTINQLSVGSKMTISSTTGTGTKMVRNQTYEY